MCAQSFFVVFDTTDPSEVQRAWDVHCEEDMARRRARIAQMLKTTGFAGAHADGTVGWEAALVDCIMHDGAPLSFDECRMRVVDKPDRVSGVGAARDWILMAHRKWAPALAVRVEGKTVVGGWVGI